MPIFLSMLELARTQAALCADIICIVFHTHHKRVDKSVSYEVKCSNYAVVTIPIGFFADKPTSLIQKITNMYPCIGSVQRLTKTNFLTLKCPFIAKTPMGLVW